jgi:cytochrome c-type biogenesis protein CcmF
VVANDRGYWGGQLSHIGLAIVAISLATTNGLAIRGTVTIEQGSSAVVAGYCFTYIEPFSISEPNRDVTGVRIAVMDASCSETKKILEPRVNVYAGGSQPIGTPSVWTGPIDDVYLGIAGGSSGVVDLNVFIFPFQWMLWAGGLIVVGGGVLAMFRKPLHTPRASESVTATGAGSDDV